MGLLGRVGGDSFGDVMVQGKWSHGNKGNGWGGQWHRFQTWLLEQMVHSTSQRDIWLICPTSLKVRISNIFEKQFLPRKIDGHTGKSSMDFLVSVLEPV